MRFYLRNVKNAEQQAEITRTTKESVEYQVSKHIIENPKQREAAQKWFQTMVSVFFVNQETIAEKSSSKPSVINTPSTLAESEFVLMDDKKWQLASVKRSDNTEIITPPRAVNIYESVQVVDCKNISAKVEQKCKAVLVADCSGVNIIVDSVVGAVEVVNCAKCQVQINGTAPTITIENSESVLLYLSEETARQLGIFTSRVSEVTVKVLDSNGVLLSEKSVPEQFKSTFASDFGMLKTEPATHSIA
jgi:hypothetical protein